MQDQQDEILNVCQQMRKSFGFAIVGNGKRFRSVIKLIMRTIDPRHPLVGEEFLKKQKWFWEKKFTLPLRKI